MASKLLSPVRIADTLFRNRIVISPMCQYSSDDGFANDWHLVHLGSRATGGAGLVIQEATAISAEGRITYADLGLWKDEHISKLQQVVNFLHARGAMAGVQLAHAGRKASCEVPWKGGRQFDSRHQNGWKTISASALPFRPDQEPPVEMSKEDIAKLISDFVQATRRAAVIGYDVIEIHAAHGYLLHQFYSPLSNQRTDEYGGSFENRIRLLMEVTTAVKKEWGDSRPLFVRLSATDWTTGGWTIEDSVLVAQRLKELGVHLIDTSTGGNVPGAKIPLSPGYQVEFAGKIRHGSGIMTGAVGLITKPEQAEQILTNEQADMILIARASLRDPNFPLHAAKVLGDETEWPVQYERAK